MKIKTKLYGVFYKDGNNSKKWNGPFQGELYTKDEFNDDVNESELELLLKECRSITKRKSKVFRQYWKSVK